MVKGLKFLIEEVERLYYQCKESKSAISCAITAQLICTFVLSNAKSRFSPDEAHIGAIHNLSNITSDIHYENMPMQYLAMFHGCKNDNFQMKNCDIFSSPEQKAHR